MPTLDLTALSARPSFQSYLASMAALDRELMPQGVQRMASYLDTLPERTRVALYGCGVISEALTRDHRPSLERLRTTFFVTKDDGARTFHGFPRTSLAELDWAWPERILVLSYVHEGAMLENLAGFDRNHILTIPEILRYKGGEVFARAALTVLFRRLRPIMEDIRGRRPTGALSGVFLMHSTGHNLMATLRRLREQGLFVVVAIHGEENRAVARTMVEAGIADACAWSESYQESALNALLLVASTGMSFLDLWLFQNNTEFVRDLVEVLPGRVVVNYDDFFQLTLENRDYAQRISQLLGAPLQEMIQDQERVFVQAAGIVYKDSPGAIELLSGRYGHRPLAFHNLPVIIRSSGRTPPKLSQADGGVHVVFAHSLWREERYQTYVTYPLILKAVESLTSAGVHFTIFNNLDPDGRDYPDLVELSRTNPFFDYRTRVPFDELLEILPQYDFGWASYHFDPQHRFDNLVKYTLGLKIFTYLGAGIPVLVSPELEYMARLVQDNGIGLVLGSETWPDLPTLAGTTDFLQLSRNIDAFCRAADDSRRIPDLLAFYREAAGQQTLGSSLQVCQTK